MINPQSTTASLPTPMSTKKLLTLETKRQEMKMLQTASMTTTNGCQTMAQVSLKQPNSLAPIIRPISIMRNKATIHAK